jgi:DNA-binding transcriptional MerR regulator
MLSANEIVNLHDHRTRAWHQPGDHAESAPPTTTTGTRSYPQTAADWLSLVTRQHRANFDLWHIEDQARAPGATDAELAEVKRRVDCTNQLRNDLAEELDRALLASLESRGLPNSQAPLNSESPGMMIDRLSILSLKIYHTREEADRPGAPPGHADRNRERLAILEQQRTDLAGCLDQLWQQALSGARRFKIYRQLKMYNDPSLNPAIYGKLRKQTDR